MQQPPESPEPGWRQIVPINDLFEHVGIYCDCNPDLYFDEEIAVHHSYDGRELSEMKDE